MWHKIQVAHQTHGSLIEYSVWCPALQKHYKIHIGAVRAYIASSPDNRNCRANKYYFNLMKQRQLDPAIRPSVPGGFEDPGCLPARGGNGPSNGPTGTK